MCRTCLPVQVSGFRASCFLNHSHFFFKKSAHSNVSGRGVFHTSLSKGKCGYGGGNIRKEIIVSAWNWDRGSFVTVGSTSLGVNDNRF